MCVDRDKVQGLWLGGCPRCQAKKNKKATYSEDRKQSSLEVTSDARLVFMELGGGRREGEIEQNTHFREFCCKEQQGESGSWKGWRVVGVLFCFCKWE